jgi:hypothetical protein
MLGRASLVKERASSACIHTCPHTPTTTTEEHYGTYIVNLDMKYSLPDPEGIYNNYRVK